MGKLRGYFISVGNRLRSTATARLVAVEVTSPMLHDAALTRESATSGELGRALLVAEVKGLGLLGLES